MRTILAKWIAVVIVGSSIFTSSNALQPTGTSGIVAHATGGQAAATVMAGMVNVVTTIGTTLDSAMLPPCVPFAETVVINATASVLLVLAVYPPIGGKIDALGTNNAFQLAGASGIPTVREFFCIDGTAWVSH